MEKRIKEVYKKSRKLSPKLEQMVQEIVNEAIKMAKEGDPIPYGKRTLRNMTEFYWTRFENFDHDAYPSEILELALNRLKSMPGIPEDAVIMCKLARM
jgi:hypothetical protein